jgi:hypothetical protein
VIFDLRDEMVSQWADWLGDRIRTSPTIPRPIIERELRLIIELLGEMVGPVRRATKPVWNQTCEHYGRLAATRGLAAGEVVEEMQFLRELLIRNLAPILAAMRPLRAMAIMLQLNRVLDQGIGVAVVGYTDALVATIFAQNGVPGEDTSVDADEVGRQIEQLEGALAAATRNR